MLDGATVSEKSVEAKASPLRPRRAYRHGVDEGAAFEGGVFAGVRRPRTAFPAGVGVFASAAGAAGTADAAAAFAPAPVDCSPIPGSSGLVPSSSCSRTSAVPPTAATIGHRTTPVNATTPKVNTAAGVE
ncbi:hypothetical protein EP51_06085 [Rhodococcus opacus]|uniref:Uncharacterized protein n=1 Tax=Rhodococcus opacus TaxID=37919 RepID=A0A076EL94_RHOOP|nr:hypothetical protein EP51_06085 [Rhodococcus opacus]